ncbi:MAG: cold shock domain-containing protein [Gammaproteobacteria bacterium]|nr:cold shock domain-containing protein [Gammaproteobacteria bacterium]
MKGTIQRYNYRKGFGFIEGTDGQEYFFHYTDFDDNKRQIRPDREVEFAAGTNEKGLFASKVCLTESGGSGPSRSPGLRRGMPPAGIFILGLIVGALLGYFGGTGLG